MQSNSFVCTTFVPVLVRPPWHHDSPAVPNGFDMGDVAITCNLVAGVHDHDRLQINGMANRQQQQSINRSKSINSRPIDINLVLVVPKALAFREGTRPEARAIDT